MDYLSTVWKSSRSFLHYNNWFEPKAKDLSGDGLIDIWRSFKKAIGPYGIKMDAMVVDAGWQDKKSIWEPSPKYFPNGYKDVTALSQKLKNEGVGFGLWLTLNGYSNDIDWGVERGYKEAQRNKYFSQYGRNYSLSATQYKNDVLKKIPFIAKETNAIYYKHDFNVLSDSGAGNNHPATERHGHEACMDAALEILVATRKLKRIMVRSCGASECRTSTALRMIELGRHVQSATAVAAASDKFWGGSEDEIGCEFSSRASSATAALPPAVCQ